MKRNLLSFVFVFILGSLVSSCSDVEETPIAPELIRNECSIAMDSSGEGITTVIADSNNRVIGISNNFNNPNLAWTADSVVLTTSTRTEQSREVFFKRGSVWLKSVVYSEGEYTSSNGPYYYNSVFTTTPVYQNNKITKLLCTSVSSGRNGTTVYPTRTKVYEYAISYNADGNISEANLSGPGLGGSFNYYYSTTSITSANIFLYKNALSPFFSTNLPILLGYFVPFTKMPTYMSYEVGAFGGIEFTDVIVDNRNNVLNYKMQGSDFSTELTGSVKTTFSCN